MPYTADFETTTRADDCRVWAWALFRISSYDDFETGNSIDTFFARLDELSKEENGAEIYFHNLRFDGQFILYWLFTHGWSHAETKADRQECSFMTVISDMGQFYSITLYYEQTGRKWRRIRILDSLKILPLPVEKLPKAFGLAENKGHIDYDADRPVGHELTPEEIAYIKGDVVIVAKSLEHMFAMGLTKMTIASNALASYKEIIGNQAYKRWFPEPEYDADVRQAYRGGFVYCNPKYQGLEVGRGIVLDVNSLYPWSYSTQKLPYGEPKFFTGQYQPDKLYDLYVQMFRCNFRLKPDHLPTIQLKGYNGFVPTEYVTDSNGEDVELCLTSVDLKLFFDHYDVYNIEWYSGWKWKSSSVLFSDYAKKWFELKAQATRDKNPALRQIAKLLLNSLYGRFGINPKAYSNIPYYNASADLVQYHRSEPEERKPLFIPIACFVTAIARDKTIRAAQSVYDRFLYADTDSLHLLGNELPPNLDIDPVELGAWAHESSFDRAKYIRAKTYIEEEGVITRTGCQIDYKTELRVTCAGMPAKLHKYVTFDNFAEGSTYFGKLLPKKVTGGVVLEPTTFNIKGSKAKSPKKRKKK